MKYFKTIIGVLFFNVLCYLVLNFGIPFYSSASLAQIKSWHANFGSAIFIYTHYLIYAQYFLSGVVVLYFIIIQIDVNEKWLFIKHNITFLLLIALLAFSTITAFLNTKKIYPLVRFPSFSSFVKSKTTPIVKVTIYDSKQHEVDLRKALKPYEIHQYNYVVLNLMFDKRRGRTKSFLDENILNDKTTLKFDTLIYKVPE